MIWRAALPLLVMLAAPAAAETVTAAQYETPTARYGHGALANGEWADMVLQLSSGEVRRISLPDELVFEDTAPRLVDLTADGVVEVVAVESHRDLGSRLVVWGPEGRIAA
ncbi:MAG: VCBS repeat-containing protein, partial [Pseudorhodobacter sp.]|nr:VCBS repeat-containing protein [Pseudorhodobacter sp.]